MVGYEHLKYTSMFTYTLYFKQFTVVSTGVASKHTHVKISRGLLLTFDIVTVYIELRNFDKGTGTYNVSTYR